ncbi:hypothetical protein BMG523Draft_02938 [Frankia sp. BMG5.23]|nr:hypothetical protein BMG523Draft_02938 [Frankia sp. BMG5.23]
MLDGLSPRDHVRGAPRPIGRWLAPRARRRVATEAARAGLFAAARALYSALEADLAGSAAAGSTADALEELIHDRGREVQRALLQACLDRLAERETRAGVAPVATVERFTGQRVGERQAAELARNWLTAKAPYLTAKAAYLGYDTALANGWPIATGVVEGTCRHLVKDRLDLTATRWGLE